MILAGLIDLGANFEKIKSNLTEALKIVPSVKKFIFDHKKVLKNGISGTQIILSFKESLKHRHGSDLKSILNDIISFFNWNNSCHPFCYNIGN